MNVTRISMLTRKENTIFIPGLTQKMIDNWKSGATIQDAMPGISPDHREFIMTGITPKEWDRFLPDE